VPGDNGACRRIHSLNPAGELLGRQLCVPANGRTVVAPIPLLTYDLGAVILNAIYAPRFQQYNNFAVFCLYFSIPFRK
jgi:hypothetical protein